MRCRGFAMRVPRHIRGEDLSKKYLIAVCGALALCIAGAAGAKLPPPITSPKEILEEAKAKAAEAKQQAEALGRAQDRAVINYRRNKGLSVEEAPVKAPVAETPIRRNEKLTCLTGTEDRHARIGVEVVNGQVVYFAYYSKSKPRTCSIEARRNGPYSRWEDKGAIATVTLVDQTGVFQIEGNGRGYRFAFRNVDRVRYCGMDGKINGSLTVTRGSSKCVLQGVMDGHEG